MSKTIEILRFLRVAPDGKRNIQVRGKLFSSVDDIPDERVQKIVRQSIAEMVELAGGVEQLAKDGLIQLPEPELPKVEPPMQAEKPAVLEPIPQKMTPPAAVPDAPEEAPPPDKSLLKRFRTLTGRSQPEPTPSLVPKLDIAGQINDVLQAKLESDPAMMGRYIDLRTAGSGELLFMVDGKPYDSVNDIEDQQAADLFRSAIAEWEKR